MCDPSDNALLLFEAWTDALVVSEGLRARGYRTSIRRYRGLNCVYAMSDYQQIDVEPRWSPDPERWGELQ